MFSNPSISSAPFTPSIAEDLRPFMESALMGSDYIRKMNELSKVMMTGEQEEKVTKVLDFSWAKPSKPISIIKTLIIHNIPRDCRVTDLRYLFEKYGPIRDIYIPRNMDRSSRLYDTIKGFALIKFFNAMDAQSAYDAEFGRLYIGFRLISIEFAKEER
jgi:FUS-interacting serine-arginine-rich protein 1